MPEPTIDDYHWLVSELAVTYLEDATSSLASLVTLTKRLRAALSPNRTHLVLEQVELRDRARAKFSQPEKMFFTRKLLEQSTDEQIARHKARRFPSDQPIADLCCGIGGDLLALLRRGPCVAVDRDPIATLLADANCRALDARNLTCEVADVRSLVEQLHCAAWHIDPDRRVAAQRTSQAVYSEPSLDVLQALFRRVEAGAIKLAPGADLPDGWNGEIPIELEWIGSRRECRQQVVWLGSLARHVGQRTATVVDRKGQCHSFTGEAELDVDVAVPGRYVYVPDSTLLASRLAGALAEELQLRATSYGLSYYTADELQESPLLEVFAVDELLNLDVKRLKRLLRERKVGTLLIFRSFDEVKVAVAHRLAAQPD
ncbi:MAG: class I SAM-dependent methyltransferase [Planctomycetia bacterium]|nr:class I SAM-dependent methyltransferase [Planctomycetia bacterium]